MRLVVVVFGFLSWAPLVTGCAETNACAEGERLVEGVCAPEPPRCDTKISRAIPVACMLSPAELFPDIALFEAELAIEPVTIRSGEVFSPVVTGKFVVQAEDINFALAALAGFNTSFTRVEVTRAEGRVSLRGAKVFDGGFEADLPPNVPKTCTYDEDGNRGFGAGRYPPCENDSDCPDVPGEPDPNRCASFVDWASSKECERCAELGYRELCEAEVPGFCAVGDAVIDLGPGSGTYVAEGPGAVFFGWADDVELIEYGADRGAFNFTDRRRTVPEDEIRWTGFDVELQTPSPLLGPVLFECIMAVNSRGPDGVPTASVLSSPTPSSMLIACPIE